MKMLCYRSVNMKGGYLEEAENQKVERQRQGSLGLVLLTSLILFPLPKFREPGGLITHPTSGPEMFPF